MRPPIRSAFILVAILAGCSGSAAPSAQPSLAPAAVTIKAGAPGDGDTASLLRFSPSTFEIKSGDVVQIVDNGDTLHDLTIDTSGAVPATLGDQNVAVRIAVDLANKTNQAAISLPPGTYKFYCSIDLGNGAGHATNGMVGTLTVH
jgi:plastocyanin